MRFLFWQFKTYVKNRTILIGDIPNIRERRRQLLDVIDDGGYQKLVVFSAGMGFLAGAYEIFAASLTIPMIKIVYYYPGKMPNSHEAALRSAVLVGAALGQLSFGFLADLYGRRRMYGFELLIMIFAILGLAMSSSGAENSMSPFGWIFFWRLVMGIGIGADYPLSATITSEFAPTTHRARMLATVFFMQPLGYFLATVTTMAVTSGYGNKIQHSLTNGTCDSSCIAAVDASWRIIIAVGAVFAMVAIYFRRTIPESPLYTAYVLNRIDEAKGDMVSLTHNTQHSPNNQQPYTQNSQEDEEEAEEAEKFSRKWEVYWSSFWKYFWVEKHYHQLAGISIAWMLLDSSFYAMNASSTSIISKLFNSIPIGGACIPSSQSNLNHIYGPVCVDLEPSASEPQPQSIYAALFSNTWRSLIVVSIGSLLGASYMIYRLKSRSPRSIQMWGFSILTLIFVGTGLFLHFLQGSINIPAIIFYVLAQIFFEIGPNFTTFVIPAEMFPTRHRASGLGFAAATGKIGASFFQLFYQFVKFPFRGELYSSADPGTIWLGFTILCFLPTLIIGVLVTKFLVPETRGEDGRALRLERWEDETGGQNGSTVMSSV